MPFVVKALLRVLRGEALPGVRTVRLYAKLRVPAG
jgi:hypothetical protein